MNNEQRAADYRKRAVATLRLAGKTMTPSIRAGFIKVAADYEVLALSICPLDDGKYKNDAPSLVGAPKRALSRAPSAEADDPKP